MEVSYGHGSPFVFASFRGGDPVVRFPAPPEVFHESAGGSVVGVCRDRRCYLLVGPPGSRWSGLGGATLRSQLGGSGRVALALLPDGQREGAVRLFARYARSPVTDTTVSWSYDEARSRVRVRFAYALEAADGCAGRHALRALPAPARRARRPARRGRSSGATRRCAGACRSGPGAGFELEHPFPGVLPALPVLPGADAEALRALVRSDGAAGVRRARHVLGREGARPPRDAPRRSRASSGSRPRRTPSRPGCARGSSPGSTPASTPPIQRRAGAFSTTRAGGR